MLKTGETSVREPPEMTLHNVRFVIKMLLHGLDYSLLKKMSDPHLDVPVQILASEWFAYEAFIWCLANCEPGLSFHFKALRTKHKDVMHMNVLIKS